jgi:hypothetical protein
MGLGNSFDSGMILAKLPAKESRATSKGACRLWQGKVCLRRGKVCQAKPSLRLRAVDLSVTRLTDWTLTSDSRGRRWTLLGKSLEAFRAPPALQANRVSPLKSVTLDKRPFCIILDQSANYSVDALHGLHGRRCSPHSIVLPSHRVIGDKLLCTRYFSHVP